jgi:hypothetical protein
MTIDLRRGKFLRVVDGAGNTFSDASISFQA